MQIKNTNSELCSSLSSPLHAASWFSMLLLCFANTVSAGQVMPPSAEVTYSAQNVIQGNSLSGVHGTAGVNMAAGENNAQSNSGAIAVGEYAAATNTILQMTTANGGFMPDRARLAIEGQAFNNSIGWMAVNQTIGLGNAQSNSIAIASGIRGKIMTDNSLGQVVSQQQALVGNHEIDSEPQQHTVEIDSSAFSGSRGIIQVNQSLGTGNATSNSFELRMGAGTN